MTPASSTTTTTTPAPSFNLADLLHIVSATVPERDALVCNGRRLTFREFDQRADALARWLHTQGIGAGDSVGIHAINCIEYMEAFLAAFKLRAVPVNINYRYTSSECRYLYGNAELKALVYGGEFEAHIAPALDVVPDLRVLLRLGVGKGLLPQAIPYEEALQTGGAPLTGITRSDDDIMLLYTGGTTGQPKGVMWTHKAVLYGGFGGGGSFCAKGPISRPEELADRVRENFSLTHLPCGPLMHGAGMWTTLIALLAGHTVFLNGRADFSADYLLDLLTSERVGCVTLVGDAMALPLLDALRAQPERWDLTHLRVLSSAGALFSDHLREGLKAFLPPTAVITNGLGSSESGQAGQGSKPDGEGLIRLQPHPSNWVVVDGVRFALPGETGIMARTGHLPLGYFKDPEKTAQTFVEIAGRRCVISGDIARLETDGSITVFGRDSQCINTGGEKVFTEEVEEAVRSADGVFDALVVGIPDARWGNKVVAVVALRPGSSADAQAIRQHCRIHLAGYKVPKDVVFVEQVPRNPMGKADYRWARELAQQVVAGAT